MRQELDPDTLKQEGRKLIRRRAVLRAGIGVAAGLTALSTLYVAAGLIPEKVTTPENEPLAPGDLLTLAEGPERGQLVTPERVALGGPPVLAYPMNPRTRVVKSQEVRNYVKLVRFRPEELFDATRAHAVEGVVAYSAVCTHLGCVVSNWVAEKQVMLCPCHGGLYDPKDGAKVVGGPPPRSLPQLPLRLEGGQLVVAGEFQGKVGPG